jgi:hypothetical protein
MESPGTAVSCIHLGILPFRVKAAFPTAPVTGQDGPNERRTPVKDGSCDTSGCSVGQHD